MPAQQSMEVEITMNQQRTTALLDRLQIAPINRGVCAGPDAWIDSGAPPIVSYNPTTGEAIAAVIPATAETYDRLVGAAEAGFAAWREWPAPRRGLRVRDLGAAAREMLEPLG